MLSGPHPQMAISNDEIGAILRFVFGVRIDALSVVTIEGGSINSVYRITVSASESYVLRAAPSEAEAAQGPGWYTAHGLRRELAVIAAASELAEFLPVTLAHDFDRALINRDWVIQKWMPGVSLASVDEHLVPASRVGMWTELGEFTRRLHSLSNDTFGPPAWGPTFLQWSDLLRRDTESLVADATRFGYSSRPFRKLATAVEQLAPMLDEVRIPALIHSDLTPAHVFVEPDGKGGIRLSGVIDLEFGRFADPLSEHLVTGFERGDAPFAMRTAFMDGYGHQPGIENEEVRVRLYAALSVAWFVPLLAFQQRPFEGFMADLERLLNDLPHK